MNFFPKTEKKIPIFIFEKQTEKKTSSQERFHQRLHNKVTSEFSDKLKKKISFSIFGKQNFLKLQKEKKHTRCTRKTEEKNNQEKKRRWKLNREKKRRERKLRKKTHSFSKVLWQIPCTSKINSCFLIKLNFKNHFLILKTLFQKKPVDWNWTEFFRRILNARTTHTLKLTNKERKERQDTQWLKKLSDFFFFFFFNKVGKH